MRFIEHRSMLHLLARAVAGGARRVTFNRFYWNIAGDCQSPYSRTLYSRPGADGAAGEKYEWRRSAGRRVLARVSAFPQARDVVIRPGTRIPYELELETRCRKCDKCRKSRASLWRMRAQAEIGLASRTWFGTMTLNPAHQSLCLARARDRLARQGVDFDALAYGEQFRELCRVFTPEVTKFLKRVRKNSGARFRYLVVAEAHKSGLPHYHALIHEYEGPVRHAVLADAWWHGYTQFKLLADTKPAIYVAKYLTKSTAVRVRASVRYGNGLDHRPKAVEARPPKTRSVASILETAQW